MSTPAPKTPPSLRRDAQAVARDCPAWNARYLGRRIGQFMERRMEGCGLTLSQFGLLMQVAAADDDTLSSLAMRLGLDLSTLSRNLQLLEREGLVELATAPDDQRRRLVWLTETGARRLLQALPAWRAAQDAFSAVIDPERLRVLAEEVEGLG